MFSSQSFLIANLAMCYGEVGCRSLCPGGYIDKDFCTLRVPPPNYQFRRDKAANRKFWTLQCAFDRMSLCLGPIEHPRPDAFAEARIDLPWIMAVMAVAIEIELLMLAGNGRVQSDKIWPVVDSALRASSAGMHQTWNALFAAVAMKVLTRAA